MRRKIDAQTAKSPAVTTGVVPDDVPMGWMHVENAIPRTVLDASYDYVPVHVHNSNKYTA